MLLAFYLLFIWLRFFLGFSYSTLSRVRRKAGNANIKRELTENWSEIYKEAVKEVRDDAFRIDLIPDTVPWTVDDFLEKNINELLKMIH